MSTGIKNSGKCCHKRSTEAYSDTICAPYFILDADMELVQLGGPLLIVIILQPPKCLYELQRVLISVDDCLLSHNVMFPLMMGFYNRIHFLVIGGVFPDII
jgi:hypothetical protein